MLNDIDSVIDGRSHPPKLAYDRSSTLHLCLTLSIIFLSFSVCPKSALAGPKSPLKHGELGKTPVERAIIYLPERIDIEHEIPPKIDWSALRDNIHQHLNIPEKGLELISIYDPDLQRSLKDKWPGLALDRRCGDRWNDDFIRLELSRAILEVDRLGGAEELGYDLHQVIDHFHCQGGTTPIALEDLRRLVLIQGINAWFLPGHEQEAKRYFRSAYSLGRDASLTGLDGPFSPESEGQLWYDYSLEIRRWLEASERVDLRIDISRYPTRTLYIDGEPLTVNELAGNPISLYPGLHFVQTIDSQGRIHSGTFQIIDDAQGLRLTLNGRDEYWADGIRLILPIGIESFLPPRFEDADELLWLDIRNPYQVIPDWLVEGLGEYIHHHDLKALYVAAPEGLRGSSEDGQLLIAQVDGSIGLREVPAKEQGRKFLTESEANAWTGREVLEPRALTLGLGLSNLAGDSFITPELGLRLASTSTISLLGTTRFMHKGFAGDERRSFLSAGLKVAKDPQSQELSWLYSFGMQLWCPGLTPIDPGDPSAGRRPIVLPAPEVSIGVEMPAHRLGFTGGRNRGQKTSFRFELAASAIRSLDQSLEDMNTTEWVFETRFSLRRWRRVLPID